MGRRTNTAKWLDTQKRWQINVQKDGQRRTFTCSTPGRNGQRECNRKADAWLDEGISGSVKVADLWQLYLKKCRDTQSRSSYLQIVSVGENYILLNIQAVLLAFNKWCRLQKTTSLRPEDVTIPEGARYRGKI